MSHLANTLLPYLLLPFFSFPATVVAQNTSYDAYLFAYFTSNQVGGENIFFAVTTENDVLNSWSTLNGGEPVLTSTKGTTGLRDPSILRAQDGTFHLLATDLSIGSGTTFDEATRTGSRYIEIWDSDDLINWGEQNHVLVAPENAGNAYAPEAYWDEDEGRYMVFFASALYDQEEDPDHEAGDAYMRVMYVTTEDFVEFSDGDDAAIWEDVGGDRYDSTVVRNGDTGRYHRFTKDDAGTGDGGCRDVIHEVSDVLSSEEDGWETLASCISTNAGVGEIEGPAVFRANDGDVNGGGKWYLFVDEFTGRKYIPLETEDIENPDWQLSGEFNLPYARHGSILPITAEERDALVEAFGPAEAV